MVRETRRERILDNRSRALQVARRQQANLEKARIMERKSEEEKLAKYGCPKKKAEHSFYETIAKIKRDREARAAEEKRLETLFDP